MTWARLFRPVSWGLAAFFGSLAVLVAAYGAGLWIQLIPGWRLQWGAVAVVAALGWVLASGAAWEGWRGWLGKDRLVWRAIAFAGAQSLLYLWFFGSVIAGACYLVSRGS